MVNLAVAVGVIEVGIHPEIARPVAHLLQWRNRERRVARLEVITGEQVRRRVAVRPLETSGRRHMDDTCWTWTGEPDSSTKWKCEVPMVLLKFFGVSSVNATSWTQ